MTWISTILNQVIALTKSSLRPHSTSDKVLTIFFRNLIIANNKLGFPFSRTITFLVIFLISECKNHLKDEYNSSQMAKYSRFSEVEPWKILKDMKSFESTTMTLYCKIQADEDEEDERDIEEVEMLLSPYLLNLDSTWNKLLDISEFVEDTEVIQIYALTSLVFFPAMNMFFFYAFPRCSNHCLIFVAYYHLYDNLLSQSYGKAALQKTSWFSTCAFGNTLQKKRMLL